MKNVYVSTRQDEYDAIVVGSGISGGWAAKELCEKGFKTLVLERGKNLEHVKDYHYEHTPDWEFKYRGLGDQKLYEKEYEVQSQCYAFGEATQHYFVNDKEDPYSTDADKPFSWIRGYHVGGRSIMWGRQVYRWSEMDFEANAKDGHGVDWPIRYKDIAPWYDYVEKFVGISGKKEGYPQLPDGQFLPAMPMNCVEEHVRDSLEKKFTDRRMTIGRVAILTQSHKGRAACHYCGPCHRGCSTGSYFSSLSSTLPAAANTGNMTLRPNSIVHSVIYDPIRKRASGVRVIDTVSKETIEYHGKIIFLCASTLGTAKILLNSTSPEFPNGIANTSGAVGHYLMDHPFKAGAEGLVEGYEDKYYHGYRPNGIYVPRFRNVNDQHPDFLRGYGFQGSAERKGWTRGLETAALGTDLKGQLRNPGPWKMRFQGFGECLPRYDNSVELDPNTLDAWGMPVLKINCTWGENEVKLRKDMQITAAEMLDAAGAKSIDTYEDENPPGLGIHEMGTARMGRDPKTSVVNGNCQTHDVSNLFITDGSVMASSACQNPSITYMALTARACDYAYKEMKRMNLV